MTVAIIIFLALLLIVLFYAFLLFDRLIRAEYEQHRQIWEADGRPAGYFWRPAECTLIASRFAKSRLSLVWLFQTPAWIANSPVLRALLRQHRLAVLIWNVGILVWAVFFLMRFI
jgi:hypothetical protein